MFAVPTKLKFFKHGKQTREYLAHYLFESCSFKQYKSKIAGNCCYIKNTKFKKMLTRCGLHIL